MVPFVLAGMAAFKVASGFQQAEMMRENWRLQEKVNDFNNEMAELDAFEAERFGMSEAARYQGVAAQTLADQKLAYASQDIDVNYGTAADVRKDSKLTAIFNTMELQRRGREKAEGIRRGVISSRLSGSLQGLQVESNAAATQGAAIMDGLSTFASGYARR